MDNTNSVNIPIDSVIQKMTSEMAKKIQENVISSVHVDELKKQIDQYLQKIGKLKRENEELKAKVDDLEKKNK